MKLHVWSVTSVGDQIYALAHPHDDHGASPIFEIAKGKATLIHELAGIEDLVGFGKQLHAIGGSFEAGPQTHVLEGKRWTTHATGRASIHTGVVIGDQLVGIGRDGFVGTWNKTSWKLATKEHYNLMLVGVVREGRTFVVAGQHGGTGVLGSVTDGKIAKSKLPVKAELLGLAKLDSGELVATGRAGTLLVGKPGELRAIATGVTADLGTVVQHEGRVLIAAREAGVLAYADGAVSVFSREPAQRLAITNGTLWKLDRKAGLASWSGKAWSAIKF